MNKTTEALNMYLYRLPTHYQFFEHECEGNTFKKTFKAAIEKEIKLISLYARGQDLSGEYIDSIDLSGGDYRGCNFSNCNLYGIDFSNCDLTDCVFDNAKIQKCRFHNTTLDGSTFSYAFINECTFEESSFVGMSSAGLSIQYCDIYLCAMQRASLYLVKIRFSKIIRSILTCSNMMYARIEESDLSGSDFTASEMKSVLITCSRALCVDFSYAYMVNARIDRTELTGSTFDFSNIDIINIPPNSVAVSTKKLNNE